MKVREISGRIYRKKGALEVSTKLYGITSEVQHSANQLSKQLTEPNNQPINQRNQTTSCNEATQTIPVEDSHDTN